MNTISWNVRGLGNPRTFRIIKDLVQSRSPQILFLCETKCDVKITERVKTACKFSGCFTVRSNGASGGLCMLWKDQCTVLIKSYSNNHIDAEITWEGVTWRFTGIYGFPGASQKHKTWELICSLYLPDERPWLLGGDFNEVLRDEEKIGGIARKSRCMEDFRKCMDECNLNDLNVQGDIFTWYGNRRGETIWERIDRFICNPNFEASFKFIKPRNLDWSFSDHRPIEISLNNKHTRRPRRYQKQFKFEELWTNYEECGDLISKNGVWKGNLSSSIPLVSDLKNCSSALSKWGKNINVFQEK